MRLTPENHLSYLNLTVRSLWFLRDSQGPKLQNKMKTRSGQTMEALVTQCHTT